MRMGSDAPYCDDIEKRGHRRYGKTSSAPSRRRHSRVSAPKTIVPGRALRAIPGETPIIDAPAVDCVRRLERLELRAHGGTGHPHVVETRAAIYGPIVARHERNLRLHAAAVTDRRKELAWPPARCQPRLTCRPRRSATRRATAGGVHQVLGCVEFLLACRPHELRPTLSAAECPVLE